jgi:hypothetical protein
MCHYVFILHSVLRCPLLMCHCVLILHSMLRCQLLMCHYVLILHSMLRCPLLMCRLYTYEFWLSLCKIVRSSVILLLPLLYNTLIVLKQLEVKTNIVLCKNLLMCHYVFILHSVLRCPLLMCHYVLILHSVLTRNVK